MRESRHYRRSDASAGPNGQDAKVRVSGLLVAMVLLVAACSDGDGTGGLRSFDLEGKPANTRPDVPELSGDQRRLDYVVVEAPVTVTAGADLDVVVELRNPLVDPVALDPCPGWYGGYGGDTSTITLTGLLPCEEIKRFEPGERIRLRLTVPSPSAVDFNEGGEYPDFTWYLLGQDLLRTSVAIPMRDPD